MVAFGKKLDYSGKVVVFVQGCCIRANSLIRDKWLYSCKVVVIGEKCLYSGKWLYLGE